MKTCVKEVVVDPAAQRFPSPANLCALISFSRNADRSLQDVLEERGEFAQHVSTILRVADLYAARKLTSDAMDFDDLLLLLRQLLVDRPSIRERLSQQFRYVLVDEYQDTNVVQSEIIRMLSSVHGNLLVVGDDAQSIYSFRAAEVKIFSRFQNSIQTLVFVSQQLSFHTKYSRGCQ